MSLRTKLSLFICALVLLVLGVAAGALYVSEREALVSGANHRREAMLEQFAQTCRDALAVHDDLAIVNAAAALRRAPEVAAAFCNLTDRRLGGGDERGMPVLTLSREVVSTSQHGTATILFYRHLADAEVSLALSGAARRMWAAFLAALAAGFLGAWLLAAHLTGPIRRLARASRRLAKGDLAHRLTIDRKDELGRLSEDFNHMAQRLGELDRMKRDFVSNVTHELRSPLSAIESYTIQMGDEVRAGRTGDLADYLNIVRNNATRLGRFINQLLDLARIESDAAAPDVQRVEVSGIFKDVVDLFAARAKEKKIALAHSAADFAVRADPDMVRQILTNLVANAIKFTPEGGNITVSAEARSGVVRLAVADTGPGISAELKDRLFNRFERGATSQKGTGLGLAIVKGLAEAQGGRAGVESSPQGSRFFVELPSHG